MMRISVGSSRRRLDESSLGEVRYVRALSARVGMVHGTRSGRFSSYGVLLLLNALAMRSHMTFRRSSAWVVQRGPCSFGSS